LFCFLNENSCVIGFSNPVSVKKEEHKHKNLIFSLLFFPFFSLLFPQALVHPPTMQVLPLLQQEVSLSIVVPPAQQVASLLAVVLPAQQEVSLLAVVLPAQQEVSLLVVVPPAQQQVDSLLVVVPVLAQQQHHHHQ
jgi:hypothetical protein